MMGMDEMPARKRLLIVDDEPDIVRMLDTYFTGEGYDTVCAGSAAGVLAAVSAAVGRGAAVAGDAAVAGGPSGERAGASGALDGAASVAPARPSASTGVPGWTSTRASGHAIDLILLDVNLPGMDGFELCRRIREHLSCPIIFLTARVEDADQLDGFAAGGDDYVLKPFSLAVLGSRVRAHLAREERRPVAAESLRIFSEVTVDFGRREVTVRPTGSQKPTALDLTRTEFDILALLAKNPGRVYDRLQIYERVWGWGAEGDPGIVREHVRRIRRKFAEAGVTEDPIGTVWGVGYRWVAQ